MSLKLTKPTMMRATRALNGGMEGTPYYVIPRNVTKTVMRENWRFTGRWLMYSQREQLEYKARNHSYSNFHDNWQNHFDAMMAVVLCLISTIYYIIAMADCFVDGAGLNTDTKKLIVHYIMTFGMKSYTPPPVWFEEEARQKKIGLFFE
eukprot:Rhum_TRINITY_DN20700_c0_g1::Rhum_TRINITY_DN20700_c0_g1_i1::g.171888::m.171888